jgi:hypothetical protein
MLPVEHALPTSLRHPWRTIAVVAAGIAALELIAIVVVVAAVVARPAVHRARAAASKHTSSSPSEKAPARPLLHRRATTVTVLNGNGISGAAASTASRVRARGYKIRRVGNAPRSGYGRSVVVYRGKWRPEAVRLAHDLSIGLVSPLDGLRIRDFKGAKLAVVVGG